MSQCCLTDPSLPIVADASVVISLNASGCGPSILRSLPNRLVLTDTVLAELRTDGRTGRNDAKLVRSLIDADLVDVVALADMKGGYFESLVVGPAAETLDDGEAATIAVAIEQSSAAACDDGKAISLCARRFPNLIVANTVDLFAHGAVAASLGSAALGDGVFAALQTARMRVPPHHEAWVVGLIGEIRAKSCSSLRSVLRSGAILTHPNIKTKSIRSVPRER